jgi:hypothetical protein
VSAAPRSRERRLLVAGAITLVFLCLCLGIPAFERSERLLFSLGLAFLAPILSIVWLVTACRLSLSRQWRPALLAALFFVVPAALSSVPLGEIEYAFREAAQRLEFTIHRSSYDDLVATTPKGDAPRFIRVSQRKIDDDIRPHFEEIWFDEADELGSADDSIRHARFEASHPKRPDQTRPPFYAIRPLGGHYYFIDVQYRDYPD